MYLYLLIFQMNKLVTMKNFTILILGIIFVFSISKSHSCTIIVAGKKATVDGSVIISHSDAGPDCRVHVIPGQNFSEGA